MLCIIRNFRFIFGMERFKNCVDHTKLDDKHANEERTEKMKLYKADWMVPKLSRANRP